MRALRVLALLPLLLAGNAGAGELSSDADRIIYRSGHALFADCSAEEGFARGVCFGYVMAIADALGGVGVRIDGLRACLEQGRSIEQLVETVTRFLAENEASRSIKADGLVTYALSLEYPCPPP